MTRISTGRLIQKAALVFGLAAVFWASLDAVLENSDQNA
jgi:hypothetical protein